MESLSASDCKGLTDKGLADIEACRDMGSLLLYGCDKITAAGLKQLAGKRLSFLLIRGCRNVSDGEIKMLEKLLGGPDARVSVSRETHWQID